MFAAVDPAVVPAAVACGIALVALCVFFVVRNVARRHHDERAERLARPRGADAALWSVTEAMPDPRNHLAIKDPTSEMKVRATAD